MNFDAIVEIRRQSIDVRRVLRERSGVYRLEFRDGQQNRMAVHNPQVLDGVIAKRRRKLPYVADPFDQVEAAYALAELVVLDEALREHLEEAQE